MLLPSLQKARESGRSSACSNNLKSLGLALALYAEDYAGYYPAIGRMAKNLPPWVFTLGSYLGKKYTADSYSQADVLGAIYNAGGLSKSLACPTAPQPIKVPAAANGTCSTGLAYGMSIVVGGYFTDDYSGLHASVNRPVRYVKNTTLKYASRLIAFADQAQYKNIGFYGWSNPELHADGELTYPGFSGAILKYPTNASYTVYSKNTLIEEANYDYIYATRNKDNAPMKNMRDQYMPVNRHSNNANYTMADGHVEKIRAGEIYNYNVSPNVK